MKQRLKQQLVIVMLVSGLSVAGATMAGGKHEHGDAAHGGKHKDRVAMLQKKLDLSDEQAAKIKLLRQEHKEDMKQGNGRNAVKKAIAKLDPNDSDYQKKLDKLADETASKAKYRVLKKGEMKAEMYKILTPEQQNKMEKLQQKRMKKHAKLKKTDAK